MYCLGQMIEPKSPCREFDMARHCMVSVKQTTFMDKALQDTIRLIHMVKCGTEDGTFKPSLRRLCEQICEMDARFGLSVDNDLLKKDR